jgi:spore maturation protein CgeB
MKIVLFYHSLLSDWNHGNAHFLRGICTSLQKLGHEVVVYEPKGGWSLTSLLQDYGKKALTEFHQQFPDLESRFYNTEDYDLSVLLEGADMVIVHEWNEPNLVRDIGLRRLIQDFTLFFHDTHHRAVSEPEAMKRYDLSHYDGVLAFGKTLGEIYQIHGWHNHVWTWHEAADTQTYFPKEKEELWGDLVWVGNWGDEERTRELHEYIIEPIKKLKLKAKFYGVRYPDHAIKSLESAGIEYGGYLPTAKVSEIFSKYKVTVHVPRKFYWEKLSGIPTIRPFEAMACGIPLLSAPWEDSENLFTIGSDFLMAQSGDEMTQYLEMVTTNEAYATQLAERGRKTVLSKHTCDHRAKELIGIFREVNHGKVKPKL